MRKLQLKMIININDLDKIYNNVVGLIIEITSIEIYKNISCFNW